MSSITVLASVASQNLLGVIARKSSSGRNTRRNASASLAATARANSSPNDVDVALVCVMPALYHRGLHASGRAAGDRVDALAAETAAPARRLAVVRLAEVTRHGDGLVVARVALGARAGLCSLS